MFSEEDTTYKGDYSEILDVTQPPVWSPQCHEEFNTPFRRQVRQMLLAATQKKSALLPICALDCLNFFGAGDGEYVGGVAWATSPSEELHQQRILYTVNQQGKISYPDPETIPFTHPNGFMPPQTTSLEAHKTYVRALDIHEYMYLYPEVFCPKARQMSLKKARHRWFWRTATVLYEAEHEEDTETEQFERRTRQRI